MLSINLSSSCSWSGTQRLLTIHSHNQSFRAHSRQKRSFQCRTISKYHSGVTHTHPFRKSSSYSPSILLPDVALNLIMQAYSSTLTTSPVTGSNVTRTSKFSLQKREWCLIMSWCRCSDIMNDDLYRGWVILEEPVSGKRLAKIVLSINMAICSYEDNVDRPLSRLITLEHILRRRFMVYFSVALVTMFRPTLFLWSWGEFEWNPHVPVRFSSTYQALYVNNESIIC